MTPERNGTHWWMRSLTNWLPKISARHRCACVFVCVWHTCCATWNEAQASDFSFFFLSFSLSFVKAWLRCSRTEPERTPEGPGIPRSATQTQIHTHTHNRHVQASNIELNLQETLGCVACVGLWLTRRHKLCSHKPARVSNLPIKL